MKYFLFFSFLLFIAQCKHMKRSSTSCTITQVYYPVYTTTYVTPVIVRPVVIGEPEPVYPVIIYTARKNQHTTEFYTLNKNHLKVLKPDTSMNLINDKNDNWYTHNNKHAENEMLSQCLLLHKDIKSNQKYDFGVHKKITEVPKGFTLIDNKVSVTSAHTKDTSTVIGNTITPEKKSEKTATSTKD